MREKLELDLNMTIVHYEKELARLSQACSISITYAHTAIKEHIDRISQKHELYRLNK